MPGSIGVIWEEWNLKSSNFLRFLLAVYVLLVVVTSLLPSYGVPSKWPIDKVMHFVAYAGMAILALFCFESRRARLAALVGAVVLGALLEWGQSFTPTRELSWLDELVNALGVIAGAVVFHLYDRFLRPRLSILMEKRSD